MQWVSNQNRGTPSTEFVGGFHFPQMGALEEQTAPITTPRIPDIQFPSTPQHSYQHSYFPEPSCPDEIRQRGLSLQTTYTRVYKTSHRSRKHSKTKSKPHKMPQPQISGPGPSELAPPVHYQVPQPYSESSNFHAPVKPPRPDQKLTHGSPHTFHYSKCTGRKKAVCVRAFRKPASTLEPKLTVTKITTAQVGINYARTARELQGCVNDAKNVRKFLMRNWNFKSESILILTDDTQDPKRLPTKANILGAMKWLVKDARMHDSLFFHFSGHGGQIRDTDGDEFDGYDEVIFPLDYEQRGVGIISDDTLNDYLVRPIPDGCRLTALFDSCHSGSALDLVYLYHSDGRLKKSEVSTRYRKLKSSAGDVIAFSGCEDSQTSADVVQNGLAVGAMSYAFMRCLDANPKQSYQQLLKSVREILRKRYSQKPQLSSSHRIDTNMPFVL